MTNADEALVVALARAGDLQAFDELVRRRQASVRRLLNRLCRNHALADDLAQETFLQCWRELRRLRANEAFAAWLRQIAINVWLQHLRRAGEHTADSAPEPSLEHSQADEIDLRIALSKLEPNERLCVTLSYNEGMSHAEIARATRLPLGTVKTLINRGAQYLRQLLAAYKQTGDDHDR